MVLGLALCASFASAQTCDFSQTAEKAKLHKTGAPNIVERPVNYKASIFTKDTVLFSTTFSATDWGTVVTPGTIGTDVVINGTTFLAHGQTSDLQSWVRVPDTAAFLDQNNAIWGTTYASYSGWFRFVANYIGPDYIENQDGFAFMWLNRQPGSGVHNAYMQFPATTRPTDVEIVDVRFWQVYSNYYDQCFVDYQVNGQWKTREINVDGVDVAINDDLLGNYSYTMPLELASQATITVRLRYYSDGTSGSVYGYCWAVDNFRIVGGSANRWFSNAQHFADGFYGTMPQGMSIPISWYGEVVNNGANTRSGINLSLQHIDANGIGTPIVNAEQTSLAPDATVLNYWIVDERGFLTGELQNRPTTGTVYTAGDLGGSHVGCWWYSDNYGANNITATANYTLQGLPVTTLGQQAFAATATSTGAEDITWDTVSYQVVGETGGDAGLSLAGYRWAKDNGIIPSNSLYAFGFTEDGNYVTDNCPRVSSNGYSVLLRYTTGNTIPTDGNGNPWVFRGLELVPQTVDAVSDIEGNRILPLMWEAHDTASHLPLYDVTTGFNTLEPYVVTEDDVNMLATGRLAPSDEYNAVNLQFFNQPVLKPNTSYYLGYELVGDGKFGVAKQQYVYRNDENTGNVAYYNDDDPEVANGYNQFPINDYDIYSYDPGAGGYIAGWNSEYAPMIRPIVGPRMSLTEFHINATCGDGVEIQNEEYNSICSSYAIAYQGGAATIYVIPEGQYTEGSEGAYKLSTLTIDDVTIDPTEDYNDFVISEGNYNVYNADSSQLLLRRTYYAITFTSVGGNHNVEARATFQNWQPIGIDPAALNVSLGLQPNPATSSVKLNISGVTGMVNCSIIDMSGRVVYNANVNAEQQQVIDLSNVAAGAYFVRVTNDNFSKVEKLIVR